MSWLNLSTSLMKTPFRGLALGLMLPLWCNPMVRGADRTPGHTSENKTGDVLLSTMQHELQRATTKLGGLDPAPYFVSYSVYDQDGTVVVGGLGSLLNSTEFHRRTGQVTMRVGSAALDNTHQENRSSGMNSGLIPLQDDPDAAARVLWQLTHEEYRQAAQSYLNVKTAAAVRTKELAYFSKHGKPIWSEPRGVEAGYKWPQLSNLWRDLNASLQALPGVQSAAEASVVPVSGNGWNDTAHTDASGQELREVSNFNRVTPGFFKTLETPISAVRWMTWRCRLERSTWSWSITPRVPMPAAARYCSRGAPSPPAPTTSTRAAISRDWPTPPISASTMWRA